MKTIVSNQWLVSRTVHDDPTPDVAGSGPGSLVTDSRTADVGKA